MKKIGKLLFTLILISVFTGNVFALSGKVVKVTGKAEVKDGSEWIQLEVGDTIEKGDVISTGFNSSVVLKIEGSEMELGPLTRMTVEEMYSSKTKDTTQVFIDSGSVSAEVNKKNDKSVGFTVRCPVATASVRGTGLDFYCNGKLETIHGDVVYVPHTKEVKCPVVSKNPPKETPTTNAFLEQMGECHVYKNQISYVDVYGKLVPPREAAMVESVLNCVMMCPAAVNEVTTTLQMVDSIVNSSFELVDDVLGMTNGIVNGVFGILTWFYGDPYDPQGQFRQQGN